MDFDAHLALTCTYVLYVCTVTMFMHATLSPNIFWPSQQAVSLVPAVPFGEPLPAPGRPPVRPHNAPAPPPAGDTYEDDWG